MFRELVENIAGYPGLFAFCALSGIAFPVPEDISLIYAGIRIDEGQMTWAPALTVALVGVLIRDVVMYGIGRFLGDWLLAKKRVRRFFGEKKLARAMDLIERRGSVAVMIGRFLIGFRSTVFLVAGAGHMSFRRFLFWDLIGLLVTVPGVVVLGYAFGPPLVELFYLLAARSREVLALLVLVAVGFALWRWRAGRVAGEDLVE